MIGNNGAQRLNEERVIVGCSSTTNLLNAHFLGQLIAVLDVQFVQRFDVFIYKGNGNQYKVL